MERSKNKKPLRGAPPSSLSQPVLSDRSRSSSPSKSRTSPRSLDSALPQTKPFPSISTNSRASIPNPAKGPLASSVRLNERNRNHQRIVLPVNRGRSPTAVGQATKLKHQRFLPRPTNSTTALSPSTSSFQLQFPSSETDHSSLSYRAFEFKTPAPVSPTTDINVTGEILPPPSISQQSVSSFNLNSDIAHQSHNSSSDMSSTIESTSTTTFRPSAEGGYKNSPMARIIRQYKDSSDDSISTWQRASTLSSKKSLLSSDVVELRSSERSYALRPVLLDDVTQLINKLQVFLERASALIPERTSYFKVDPRDTFLSILKESSDISQLRAAWMGLIRRLTLAQENLVKYELQYRSPLQGETVEMPTSPISTDIGIYEALEDVEDVDFRMRYIYKNVPHHQDQVKSPESLRDGSPWSSILTLPDHSQRASQNRLPTIVKHSPEAILSIPPLIPAGIHRNPTEIDRKSSYLNHILLFYFIYNILQQGD